MLLKFDELRATTLGSLVQGDWYLADGNVLGLACGHLKHSEDRKDLLTYVQFSDAGCVFEVWLQSADAVMVLPKERVRIRTSSFADIAKRVDVVPGLIGASQSGSVLTIGEHRSQERGILFCDLGTGSIVTRRTFGHAMSTLWAQSWTIELLNPGGGEPTVLYTRKAM